MEERKAGSRERVKERVSVLVCATTDIHNNDSDKCQQNTRIYTPDDKTSPRNTLFMAAVKAGIKNQLGRRGKEEYTVTKEQIEKC